MKKEKATEVECSVCKKEVSRKLDHIDRTKFYTIVFLTVLSLVLLGFFKFVVISFCIVICLVIVYSL